MVKRLCIGSLVVAILMAIVFALDLVAGIPFTGAAPDSPYFMVDLFGFLAAGIIAYQAYNAYRDVM